MQKQKKKSKLTPVFNLPSTCSTIAPMSANTSCEWEQKKEEYLLEKTVSGLSVNSVKSYKNLLALAFQFIPTDIKQKPLSAVTQRDIDTIYSIIQAGKCQKTGHNLSDATKETYLRNLRQFVKWCVKHKYMAEELFVRPYKAPQAPPKMYTEDELAQLCRPPLLPERLTFEELRNYTMCVFLAETGVRRLSLANLRLCDLDLKNNQVQIAKSKNKSVYRVAVSDNLVGILYNYLQARVNSQTEDEDYLFCDKFQRQLTPDGINSIIEKYAKSRGVHPKGVHAFRHSCATLMVKNGATVAEVAQQTGHKDMRQVQGYVHAVSAMKKDKFEKLNPLSAITAYGVGF